MRRLFPGVELQPLALPGHGPGQSGFRNDTDRLMLGLGDVQTHLDVLERVAAQAAKEPGKLAPCLTGGLAKNACLEDFVRDLIQRAYREPADDADVEGLMTFAAAEADAYGDETGLSQLLGRVLLSPRFLFLREMGRPVDAYRQLTAHERAAGLAYTLTNAPPDDPLWAAAQSGGLDTPDGFRAQARRLLQTEASSDGLFDMFRELFRHQPIGSLVKDEVFKGFSAQVAGDMAQSLEAFFADVIWQDDGRLETLLTAPYTLANQRLAAFYGWPDSAQGEDFQRVAFGAEPRAGVLGQGGLLAELAHSNQNDVVRRGRFVRETLLCEMVPAPPPTVAAIPPLVEGNLTLREQLTQHAEDPSCKGCHERMDPIGFAFEAFDAVGRHRTAEAGRPVNASGAIIGSEASDGAFHGAKELAQHLAGSRQVQDCVVGHAFRFVVGRKDGPGDACALNSLGEAFRNSNGDLRDVVVEALTAQAFLARLPAP